MSELAIIGWDCGDVVKDSVTGIESEVQMISIRPSGVMFGLRLSRLTCKGKGPKPIFCDAARLSSPTPAHELKEPTRVHNTIVGKIVKSTDFDFVGYVVEASVHKTGCVHAFVQPMGLDDEDEEFDPVVITDVTKLVHPETGEQLYTQPPLAPGEVRPAGGSGLPQAKVDPLS